MDVDATFVCKNCQKSQSQIEHGIWCLQCNDLFCTDCMEKHDLDLTAQFHTILDFSDSQNLFPSIINSKANQIKEEIHDSTCKKDVDTSVETTNSNATKMIENTQNNISENLFNFQDVINNRERNLVKLQDQRKTIQNNIREIRIKMQEHLDNMEEEILSELSVLEEKLSGEIEVLLVRLREREENMSKLYDYTSGVKSMDLKYPKGLVAKDLVKNIHDEQSYFDSLYSTGKLDEVTISFNINKEIEDFFEKVESLGTLEISKNTSTYPCTFPCANETGSTLTEIPSKLTLKQVFTTFHHGFISGCCTLPNGEMIFADFDGINNDQSLLFYKPEGTFIAKMPLFPVHVFDVSYIENNHIAVSGGYGKNIAIIDLSNNTVIKIIKTELDIGGIFYRKGEILYCVKGKGLYVYNLSTGTENILYTDETVTDESYVVGYRDHICYTNGHKLKALDSQLNIIFEYSDETILKDIRGVVMDEHMNIYVVGCQSNSLVVVSADGTKSKELLNGKDGLNFPMAIHYDKERKILVVSNIFDKAYIYVMEYA